MFLITSSPNNKHIAQPRMSEQTNPLRSSACDLPRSRPHFCAGPGAFRFAATVMLAATLVLLFSGCSSMRNAWDKTTDVYETYIDPKPEIDLEQSAGLSRKEKELARQFSAMDQELELLLRTLTPQDSFPSTSWAQDVQHRFPWLTAFLAVDTHGELLTSYPETPLKPIQTAPLLDREWSVMNRRLQGFVEETSLGPELIIAGPFFRDGVWQGLLVAHFDPRSLIRLAPDSNNLVLLTPGTLIWSALDETTVQALVNAPWENILKSNVQGRWSSGSQTFGWISRPIGDLRLIYAVLL